MDEVTYGELDKEEAQPLVTKYKEEARKLLPPSEKRTNRRNNRNKRNRQNRSRGQGQGYGESWGRPAPGPSALCAERDPSGNPGPSLTRNKEATSLWRVFPPVLSPAACAGSLALPEGGFPRPDCWEKHLSGSPLFL